MTLRYGAIGCGRAFERLHLPALRAAGVDLVAVYDPDPERAKALAGDAAVADSVEALLGHGLDAVSVCSPNDAHVGHVLAAAATGARVLCEKPLAHSPAALARLRSELPDGLRVNLPYLMRPGLAVDGDVTVEIATPGARLWRPVSDWYGDAARAGGGALLDLGVHALSLLWSLLGPLEVESCALSGGPVEDAATVVLRAGGRRCEVVVNRRSPRVVAALRSEAGTYDLRGGEDAAVAAFAAGGEAPGPAAAVAAEEAVWSAYALART